MEIKTDPGRGAWRMYSILIVDDDPHIRRIMARYLEKAGFRTLEAGDRGQANQVLRDSFADLSVLDIMLPDGSGLDICKDIREEYGIPVIMMTARGGIEDKMLAFRNGADDYLVKPFDPNELVLRVQAVLKRTGSADGIKNPMLHKHELAFGAETRTQLVVDTLRNEVRVGGQAIAVPRKEYQLLSLLALNAGRALSRDQIIEHLWGLDFSGDQRVVDLYLDRLRKRLKPANEQNPGWSLKTVWGVGYRLEEGS